MRQRDREALRDVGEALETASIRMARVVCETGAPDDVRKFVQKQWQRLAAIQTDIEARCEAESEKGKAR